MDRTGQRSVLTAVRRDWVRPPGYAARFRWPQSANSVLFLIPSFLKILHMYSLTVPGVRWSSNAISLFDLACVTRCAICLSRVDRLGEQGLGLLAVASLQQEQTSSFARALNSCPQRQQLLSIPTNGYVALKILSAKRAP